MKKHNKLLQKCFPKVTVKIHRESKKEGKLDERWKHLKNKDYSESKTEVADVIEELAEEYFNKVKLASRDIDCAEGGIISSEMWKLKKEIFPLSTDPPIAMMDDQGNLVTDAEIIKDIDANAQEQKLRRPMKEGMETIKEEKYNIANKVMEAARTIKQSLGTWKTSIQS